MPASQSSISTYDKILLWGIIISASLAKKYVAPDAIPGLSFGDVLVACILMILIIRFCLGSFILKKNRSTLYIIFLLFWALGSVIFIIIASPINFSEEEFIKSFLKLSLYSIATIFLVTFFQKVSKDVTQKSVLIILILNALITLYIYFVIAFEVDFPYKFFLFNQPEYLISNVYYRNTEMVVASGIFNEPSYLGIFQNMGLAYLLFSNNSKLKFFNWKCLIIILPILLTFSITAYSMLVINLFIWLIKERKFNLKYIIYLILLIIVIVPLIVSPIFDLAIVSRIDTIFNGADGSANARLLGSWEPALLFMSESPIFGAGLGNFDVAQKDISSFRYMSGKNQGWNVFAYVLGTLGIIGFIIFILFIADLFNHNFFLGIVFFVSLFASGNFLDISFWVFYSLISAQGPSNAKS